jgi:hypothetical protein
MVEIYAPKTKVAIASSFEGVFNNGAPECALTSINAYTTMNPGTFYKNLISVKDFNKIKDYSFEIRGFLALRPLVAVAEDYHTIAKIIIMYPDKVQNLLDNPNNEILAHHFEDLFKKIKEETKEERERFGKGKESLFYQERERLKKEDIFAWMNTQEPYETTLFELRKLAETQRYDGDKIISGFVPYFATSKDEESTHNLCVFYTEAQKLIPSDIEGKHCIIPRGRIIGMETVPSRNKLEQLKVIAEKEDVPHSHIWRVNDMVFNDEIEELFDNGFRNIFIVTGGYVFPYEIEKIRKDKRVKVVESENMAQEISQYAKEWGF